MDTSLFFDEDALYQWEFKNKGYAHFDTPYSKARVNKLFSDISRTGKASHNFYPFIRFSIPKYKRDPETRRIYEDKENPRYIMHTARIDANLYSLYRNILMNKYEVFLKKHQVDDTVIAYRKIPTVEDIEKNKCNVHFANEAMDEIIRQTNENKNGCVAIALDIKGFFDNLDHVLIKRRWCKVMGFEAGMPDDHWTIYKNITRYKYIDASDVEKSLKINFSTLSRDNRKKYSAKKKGEKTSPPILQICDPEQFKDKVLPKLSPSNNKGIPQGTTISDVIANVYMIDFDIIMKKFATKYNGYYRRYSDDILLILPQKYQDKAMKFVNWLIQRTGKTLYISENKTLISQFEIVDGAINCRTYNKKGAVGKPFEYLGLSFDGEKKRIRQSTISGFYDKLSYRIKKEVKIVHNKLLRRGVVNPSPDEIYKIISFDMIRNSYMECRDHKPDEEFLGNFYTYVSLVEHITGNHNVKDIFKELGGWIKKRARKYCNDIYEKHSCNVITS